MYPHCVGTLIERPQEHFGRLIVLTLYLKSRRKADKNVEVHRIKRAEPKCPLEMLLRFARPIGSSIRR